jgi:CheY-like chemotaxis protein
MDSLQTVEDAGYTALGACDADEAIAILESRGDVQAVFTDIKMPGSIDGVRLAHAIRGRWPPVHLILTSGGSIPDEDKLPEHARFIRKPYGADQVAAALYDLLSNHPRRIGGVSHLYQSWRRTSLQFACARL